MTLEKISLGKKLFFDPRLSSDASVSCATCHKPNRAFTDGETNAVGIGGAVGHFNTPTVLNAVFGEHFFWDGRVRSLEEQALGSIQNPIEMNMPLPRLEATVRSIPEYTAAFARIFTEGVTARTIAQAIASYERTLVVGDSRVDRYYDGEAHALSASEVRGLSLFLSAKTRCAFCHAGSLLSDGQFHNTGSAVRNDGGIESGRYNVGQIPSHTGAFKTPSLRNIALTAPYFHDGRFKTLDAVLDFYAQGGVNNVWLDGVIAPFALTPQERQDLIAFLHALTSE